MRCSERDRRVPNDFLHRGFFASLDHAERSLYFVLVLAGDRNGVSYYAHDRICAVLELTLGGDALTAASVGAELRAVERGGEPWTRPGRRGR